MQIISWQNNERTQPEKICITEEITHLLKLQTAENFFFITEIVLKKISTEFLYDNHNEFVLYSSEKFNKLFSAAVK